MSAQTIPVRMRKSFGSWRYAILAAVVAIALAIALVIANGGSTGQTTGTGGGSGQTTGSHQSTTIVVPGGEAAGHPLP